VRAVLLEELTWLEAERVLTPRAIVVLPIGAAAKEHGPHLKLKNDFLLAEHLKRRVLARGGGDVVVAPTIAYHHYPAFVEYPGSTTLSLETARDLVVDIVSSLARHGPRRFYALNTGVSTLRALRPAAEVLAARGVLLRFTDILALLEPVERAIGEQERGTHADEIETSIMLAIAPRHVDMTKASRDCHEDRPGPLTRDPAGAGTYSPTGTFGDPTLATRAKGRRAVAALVAGILADLAGLRRAPLPPARV